MPNSPSPNIAILVAMEEELAPFLAASTAAIEFPQETGFFNGGAKLYGAEIGGKIVLLMATGVGLVNAAVSATIAITQRKAQLLISAGSAGGIGNDVHVGDVVVATETCYSSADATAFTNYVLGQIPQMPPRYSAGQLVLARLDAIELAEGGMHHGLILSSDAFIWEKNYADYVGKFPDALATDMETAAIGQVAYKFGVPWVSIRGISDLCGPAGPDDFYTHLDGAANIAAGVVVELVKNL